MLSESGLARRMAEAVEEDARLQALDAAKKRAVAQRADIDTFNALVSAARLRPLAGGLRAVTQPSSKPPAARSFRADGTIAPPAGCSSRPSSSSSSAGCAPVAEGAVRSGALFARAWRGATPAARLNLLRAAVATGALPRLLRLELSSGMLEQLGACLAGALEAAEADGDAAAREAAAALAAAALLAARGAAGYAVVAAGLSLQGRQRLGVLERAAGLAG